MNQVWLSGVLESVTEKQVGEKTHLEIRLTVTETTRAGKSFSYPVELKATRDMEIIKSLQPHSLVELVGRVYGRHGKDKWAGRVFQDIEIERIKEV